MLLVLFALFALVDGLGLAGAETVPARLYVLSRQANIGQNALIEVNLPEGKAERSARLLPSNVASLSRDPLGRLWVALSQSARGSDNRVQIFSADLQPLRTITTSRNPEAGICFNGDRALVACAQNGFGGAVDAFDLKTLDRTRSVQIPGVPEGAPYLLTAMASSASKVVLAGMTTGTNSNRRYGVITVLDPSSLAISWQSKPIENLDVWTILPHGQTFFLLNLASGDEDSKNPADLLALGPDNSLERVSVGRSPLWGAIAQDVLYLYHNPTWNSAATSPQRALSTYHVKKQTVTRWLLPDNWDARGICVIGDRILLTSRVSPDTSRQGVYQYDPLQKTLSLLVPVPGADKVVPAY